MFLSYQNFFHRYRSNKKKVTVLWMNVLNRQNLTFCSFWLAKKFDFCKAKFCLDFFFFGWTIKIKKKKRGLFKKKFFFLFQQGWKKCNFPNSCCSQKKKKKRQKKATDKPEISPINCIVFWLKVLFSSQIHFAKAPNNFLWFVNKKSICWDLIKCRSSHTASIRFWGGWASQEEKNFSGLAKAKKKVFNFILIVQKTKRHFHDFYFFSIKKKGHDWASEVGFCETKKSTYFFLQKKKHCFRRRFFLIFLTQQPFVQKKKRCKNFLFFRSLVSFEKNFPPKKFSFFQSKGVGNKTRRLNKIFQFYLSDLSKVLCCSIWKKLSCFHWKGKHPSLI